MTKGYVVQPHKMEFVALPKKILPTSVLGAVYDYVLPNSLPESAIADLYVYEFTIDGGSFIVAETMLSSHNFSGQPCNRALLSQLAWRKAYRLEPLVPWFLRYGYGHNIFGMITLYGYQKLGELQNRFNEHVAHHTFNNEPEIFRDNEFRLSEVRRTLKTVELQRIAYHEYKYKIRHFMPPHNALEHTLLSVIEDKNLLVQMWRDSTIDNIRDSLVEKLFADTTSIYCEYDEDRELYLEAMPVQGSKTVALLMRHKLRRFSLLFHDNVKIREWARRAEPNWLWRTASKIYDLFFVGGRNVPLN